MNKLLMLWTRKYQAYAFALFCTAVIVVGISLLAPVGQTQTEPARSANSFVDSIGVNTHLYYDNSVYYRNYGDIIKPKLLALGIHHIRDGAVINYNGYYDRLKELRNFGISASLSADPRGVTVQQAVEVVKGLGNAVEAIEGPNEYNNSGDGNWVNTVCTYVQQLYQAIKGDSATAKLPVVAPSFTSEAAYKAVGDLSAAVDYGNMHNYYAGRNPGTGGWGSYGYGSLEWNMQVAQKQSSSKQVLSTETGYNNAVNTTSGNTAIPEAVAGKYIPRLFLEQFNYGIPRTWSYELIDAYNNSNARDSNFGLLRNDGSEKPAYSALKNLIGLLNDPGFDFKQATLDYSLSSNATNLHHTLLQKCDGKFYLILWQELPSFDLQQQVEISVPDLSVTLTLNTVVNQAAIYQPNNSVTPTAQYTNPRQISLNVPDYPLVIELVPA